MKRYYLISVLIAMTIIIQAQNQAPRISRGGDRNVPQQRAGTTNTPRPTELSVRAQRMNEQLTQEPGNARWIRNILRELDLTKEKNAPLYYPVKEMNGMKNLFTTLFQLASEGKINLYGYENESFDDDNLLSFRAMLDKFHMIYETIPANGNLPERYVVNASDIPSREATKLYVKESWYFDQNNSIYDVKTLAICPIAFITMESGEELPQGMFWVKYEDIRPYIKSKPIMTSSINNAKIYTMDDFFRRRMYDGDIIQTENLMNLPLAMLFDTEEEIVLEQKRIEDQLKAFNDSLWVPVDTTTVVVSKKEARKASSTRSSSVKSEPKEKVSKGKVTKEKTPKQPKAPAEKATKSTPTRSIRR